MTILDTSTVDFMGKKKDGGAHVLGISDHLDWEDTESHLKYLQDKLNAYLDFIEAQDLVRKNPTGEPIEIEIHFLNQPPKDAIHYLSHVNEKLESEGIQVHFIKSEVT